MTDWSAERLDALPDGTVIESTYGGKQLLSVRVADGMTRGMWVDLEERGDCVSSRRIWVDADDGSIRVVSVPIDALLSWDACKYAARVVTGGSVVDIIRAAIAHVTGEAS